ncbi:MAG: SAM-dependent methyltransferase [Flavobacteriales bacterium]|nr:SAM-dependent methyltransferase [Flavobacteriales bacterium]
MTGTLYMVPTPLGEEAIAYLPPAVTDVLHRVEHYIVEDEKQARRFLRKIGMKRDFATLHMSVLNEHTPPMEWLTMLAPLSAGHDIALISDAGCPGVADPGSEVVRIAHEKNIRVVPLPGPSSIIQALMAGGLNGQQFTFCGYLPRERAERIRKLKEMEQVALSKNISQVFMDTPYRTQQVWADMMDQLKDDTMVCLALGINTTSEFIRTWPVKRWKKQQPPSGKIPCMFIIGK